MRRCIAAAILLALAAGCARVEVRRLASDNEKGVRFYRPWPYLLVTQTVDKDGKTSFSTSIIQLPDRSQQYVAEVIPGWGTVEGSIKLQDGWMLTEIGAKSDSKGPETIGAVAGLIKELGGVGVLNLHPTDQKTLAPGLYRLKFNAQGQVAGTEAVDLTPQKPAAPDGPQ